MFIPSDESAQSAQIEQRDTLQKVLFNQLLFAHNRSLHYQSNVNDFQIARTEGFLISDLYDRWRELENEAEILSDLLRLEGLEESLESEVEPDEAGGSGATTGEAHSAPGEAGEEESDTGWDEPGPGPGEA